MSHLRERYLEATIQHDLSWSPIVSILGMRQIGKTTLLRQIGNSYLTLDEDAVLNSFERGDWSAIERKNQPLVIDEAQKSGGLFDRVKWLVDQKKRPGQFLLTGSVRFLSRKHIRESLTGRTSILELLPLTLSESLSQPASTFFRDLIQLKAEKFIESYSSKKSRSLSDVEKYTDLGGMPGICFKRDKGIRLRMRDAHLETLLMRDIQFVMKTRVSYIKLRSILSSIAQTQGQLISLSAIARSVQISTPTLIRVLEAFENLFILRRHGKAWFFSDCGMASFLGADSVESRLFHMERFLFQELYSQLAYQYKAQFTFDQYHTRGGVRIPFVVKVKDKPILALVADPTEGASEKSLKSLTWFSKRQKKQIKSIVLHHGTKGYVSSTGALCVPYYWTS